jgi:hypothetical protein
MYFSDPATWREGSSDTHSLILWEETRTVLNRFHDGGIRFPTTVKLGYNDLVYNELGYKELCYKNSVIMN